MTPDRFFDALWDDFVAMAPVAARIRSLLEARGELVANDHVAFRTFNLSPLHLEALEPHLFALGYERIAPYHFKEKKLRAFGYLHRSRLLPRVFVSELLVEQCSPFVQRVVDDLMAQLDPKIVLKPEVFWSGRPWAPISHGLYQELYAESEYAAWVAAIGLRANHFTVSVNALKTFGGLPELMDHLEEEGYAMNHSGGRIKGTPAVLLEQGSTLADVQPVEFSDGVHHVPTCYYEFALRHRDSAGQLYEGFVAASADKIFESTHVRS
jgi:hypothetical protein